MTVNAIAPGYVATKMVMAIKPEVLQTIIDRPDEAPGQSRKKSVRLRLPVERPVRLHHRRHHQHQRRSVHQ